MVESPFNKFKEDKIRVMLPKRPRNVAWFKEKLLVESQKADNPSELSFHDLDAYDSNCDDLSSAKAILMANLSRCDLEVLSEIKEDSGKHFVTQKELSAEQTFWLKYSSLSETPVTPHTHVRIKVPSELPKIMSQEILHIVANSMDTLDLQPYRQSTVVVRLLAQVGPKFFGPYKTIERLGPVAYRLELPPDARIHNVFHVSLLKKCNGDPPIPVSADTSPALMLPSGPQPEAVLGERVVQKGKYRPKTEILVKWKGFPREDATWENKWRFQKAHSDFHLEDKVNSSGGD
uniref:Chromo domain-containing protein n=1 Tax=Tanacetum cinerariifolium TaxID=118510 RepID=A0A6L2MDA1_TANCI|nr:hypothetical protein [Tanacetum cinerariifolium]